MRRGHTTMSLSNLLQELHDFTTQVKTNNVPVISYSTSTLLLVLKSLGYNIIPFHNLLLLFLFFIVPELKFFTARTRWKIRPKNQNFEKFLACKNGSGQHKELANDAHYKMNVVNFASNSAQFMYTSFCEVSKCPATSLFNSTLFNFHSRTRLKPSANLASACTTHHRMSVCLPWAYYTSNK